LRDITGLRFNTSLQEEGALVQAPGDQLVSSNNGHDMKTIVLLVCSNIFMTFAWYGHLKYRNTPLFAAIVVSWLIAFAEYCFQVPANRIGYGEFTAFQLKIIQEVITLCVFVVFAWWYLGEGIRWNHAISFLFLVGAVTFAFWGKL
jgi:uncharacterized protein (DUF486 family)